MQLDAKYLQALESGRNAGQHARGLMVSSAVAPVAWLVWWRGRLTGLPASDSWAAPAAICALAGIGTVGAAARQGSCGKPWASLRQSMPAAVAVPLVRSPAAEWLPRTDAGASAKFIRLTGRTSPVAV